MRTVRNLSPLRKLCSKIEPVSRLRSLALMTAPARASLMCSTLTMDSSCPSISNIVPLRKSLVEIIPALSLLCQILQCQLIAHESEACNHTPRGACGHTPGPELLSCVDVGEVDLHHRQREGLKSIVEDERVVGEPDGVDDYARRGG